uniref:UBR-type domain-containing protein n=1 Tax=Glossina palpalis gambiensis TaxID=67801 RepID=A0A1B0ATL0_9MUSC
MENQISKSSAEENELEESSVTMLDVLEEEKEREEEYAAVLGGSDEKCCTYSEGAIKRQALYSCLTCCPESRNDLNKCAGVCLACSYQCHENHELIELYTKRNFRCDCPTERMAGNRCRLNANLKQPIALNENNIYNQNFQGLYCNCHRPYPDPETTVEEFMLQCVICEDWFHSHHLNASSNVTIKLMEACSEMICGPCMDKHAFLQDYTGLSLSLMEQSVENSEINGSICDDVRAGKDNDYDKLRNDLDKSISDIMNIGEAASSQTNTDEPKLKRQKLEETTEEQSTSKTQTGICRRPTLKSNYESGPTFWAADWRLNLCRCMNCMDMYKSDKVEFFLDNDDTAKSYEERGMRRAASESSAYEQGIQALASINRVQQIDAITEYNHMKDRLKEYLHTFVVSKKVVTEEDINRFFNEMRSERNATVGQPYFCR